MKKEKTEVSAVVILFVLLFAAIAHNFLSQNLWDYDFWWHISTGRYIVETGSLPEADPFSYTSSMKENENLFPEREEFLLKQYWLGQVIFYLVYQNIGAAGMIILRTAILLLALLIVLWQLRRWDVSFYIIFIFVCLFYLVTLKFTGERPVLFTILFTPLVFVILEGFKDRDGKLLYALPPLMLFWANVHGGFIIGNIMIMVYMVTEGLKMLLRKTSYSGRRTAFFYSAVILALAASYINPLGWDAFIMAFSPKYAHLQVGIQEYQSPYYFFINKYQYVNIGYFILALLFPLILIIRNKKLDLTHAVLLTGFFVMAAKSTRFIIYYAPVAAMVLGRETDNLLKDLFKNTISEGMNRKIIYFFSVVTLVSAGIFFFSTADFNGYKFDVAGHSSVPVSAVDFMEESKLSGKIFNSPAFGGYITWRLYPRKKTFIDTRWLNIQVSTEYKWIMSVVESINNSELPEGKQPLWKRLLDHYSINVIMLNMSDDYGNVLELILKLAGDKEWVPVYMDSMGIIFARRAPEHELIIARFEQPKENVYNIIIGGSSLSTMYKSNNPAYFVTIGRTFYEMGRFEDALTALQYASKKLPKNQRTRDRIRELEEKLKRQNIDSKR